MSTVTDATRAAQDQYLTALRQSQHAIVDAIAAWSRAVQESTPKAPPVPSIESLPTPQEVIDNTFDFAQKLLDAQRDFTHNVISATSPVVEKSTPENVKKAA